MQREFQIVQFKNEGFKNLIFFVFITNIFSIFVKILHLGELKNMFFMAKSFTFAVLNKNHANANSIMKNIRFIKINK